MPPVDPNFRSPTGQRVSGPLSPYAAARADHAIQRERLVFGAIVTYKQNHGGNFPKIRELMVACEIPSTSSVTDTLRRLAKRGLIVMEGSGRGRTIRVPGERWSLVR